MTANPESTTRPTGTTAPMTALTVMVGLAAAITLLVIAKHVLLPMVIASLWYLLLRPAVRAMRRLRIPASLAAAIVIGTMIGVLVIGLWLAAGPASEWAERLTRSAPQLKDRLADFRGSFSHIAAMAQTMADATAGNATTTFQVAIRDEGWGSQIFGLVQIWLSDLAFAAILAFFMLAAGDHLPSKLADACALNHARHMDHCFEVSDQRDRVREIINDCEHSMSRYLILVTTINLLLGVAVATGCWLTGMPNPLLWGLLAAVLNFIPYFGATVGFVILAVAGILSFETFQAALMPAVLYFVANFIESEFVTPYALHERFTLDPIVTIILDRHLDADLGDPRGDPRRALAGDDGSDLPPCSRHRADLRTDHPLRKSPFFTSLPADTACAHP